MDYFRYDNGELCADGVPLRKIAEQYGTPCYVYSAATLERHTKVLYEALEGLDATVCYAVKANGNLSVLRILGAMGCGFDAVSLGELLRVHQARLADKCIIFSGVGKTDEEMREALRLGVHYISAESFEEVRALAHIAASEGLVAPLSLRVNPEVDAKTHPYISTGLKENKFGVAIEDLAQIVAFARSHKHLNLVGLSCHIGSQITSLGPFEDAAHRMVELTRAFDVPDAPLSHIGMGGGLGIPYGDEAPPSPKAYGEKLKSILAPLKKRLILEPGRVLVGNAGILLARVVRHKRNGERRYVLLDAGMNDLMRPALYQARHALWPVTEPTSDAQRSKVDVVGPVCESSDAFARDVMLPELKTGACLAIRSAGAYGFAMANSYNARRRPAEVICKDGKMHLARARESYEDLWRGELS